MSESFQKQAEAKLGRELKSGSFDRYGQVMKQGVHDALLEFCRQEEEFAQAVVQGGSFQDCVKAVGKCVKGSGISDMEAYGAAVRFYFPGAELKVSMTIDLIGSAADGPSAPEDMPRRSPADNDGGGTPSGLRAGREKESLLIDLSEFF